MISLYCLHGMSWFLYGSSVITILISVDLFSTDNWSGFLCDYCCSEWHDLWSYCGVSVEHWKAKIRLGKSDPAFTSCCHERKRRVLLCDVSVERFCGIGDGFRVVQRIHHAPWRFRDPPSWRHANDQTCSASPLAVTTWRCDHLI